MNRLVLIGIMCFALAPNALAATDYWNTDWMGGSWAGVGSQGSNGSTWSILLTVERQGPGYYYKIEYPSLGCSGYWTLNSAQSSGLGGVASFTEHIIDGREKCVNNGTISVGSLHTTGVDVQDMRYHWTGVQPDGKQDNASATLNRRSLRR